MLNKYIIFLLLLLSTAYSVSAQNDSIKKRYVYFELAGSGGVGSINYEKPFFKKNKLELIWRTGFSIAPIDRNNGVGLVFPLMVNAVIGQKSHALELGIGQGLTLTTKGSFFILMPAVVGYRYYPANKNWFYRVSYTPLISYLIDFQVQQWAGLSVGYVFKSKTK